MDVNKYLARINYLESQEPELNTLKSLQRHHLLHIPFENLDIHRNVEIRLELDRIYDKIVNQNRGGFCYELNGLFCELLIQLGFQVDRISARVFTDEKGYGPEMDHLALIVHLPEGDYLVDVGFGEFVLEPLKFELNIIQHDSRGSFTIDNWEGYYRVKKIELGEQKYQYIFHSTPRKFEEFAKICHFQQTNPDSHFRVKRAISKPTMDGRITLAGDTLKIKKNMTVTETKIEGDQAFSDALLKYFGFSIDDFVSI